MHKGIYCLLIRLDTAKEIKIGALGIISFRPGWYLYVGSALGSGGLSRVSRHIRFYREHYRKPKWHIDYLSLEAVLFETICAKTEERLECRLAETLGGTTVERFGCSDCDCTSHLFYRKEYPEQEIISAFLRLGLKPNVHAVHR
ncbi:MAG: GIY-YIG nuclease family protein [Methanocorpusculum sp.]|nr:GIY-YIG nuclease family protein [Methanocorpusculum sp.]